MASPINTFARGSVTPQLPQQPRRQLLYHVKGLIKTPNVQLSVDGVHLQSKTPGLKLNKNNMVVHVLVLIR